MGLRDTSYRGRADNATRIYWLARGITLLSCNNLEWSIICRNPESLCCTPELILQINYISREIEAGQSPRATESREVGDPGLEDPEAEPHRSCCFFLLGQARAGKPLLGLGLHPQTPRDSGVYSVPTLPPSPGENRSCPPSCPPCGQGTPPGLLPGGPKRLQAQALQVQSRLPPWEVRRSRCASVVSMEICQPGNLDGQLGLGLQAFVFAKPFLERKH